MLIATSPEDVFYDEDSTTFTIPTLTQFLI